VANGDSPSIEAAKGEVKMPIYDAASIPDKVTSSTKDPEIAKWLITGPVLGAHKPIHVQRREHDAFIDPNPPAIGRIEHLGLRGPHGTIPVRVYYPSQPGVADGGALIYLHGGGFIVGSLDQFDTAMRRLSEGSGAQVYAVDYKLAPEYQWPVQIEEGEFVVRWLFEHATERNVDPLRIALGGDSAGGNQTCVIAQKLRDQNGPKLALQVPLYPEAKMPFETRAGIENVSGGYVDTAGVLLFVWSLVPQGVDYSQPYITPLNATSFADLPKTLLVTCGFDMLRDVGHAYAKKLAEAGNKITYVHYPDLPHGIIQMTMHSKRCLEATMEIAQLLGKSLQNPHTTAKGLSAGSSGRR
jgi:acetyl esterase